MPITFNEVTNRFEGDNAFGETLAGFDFSVFGGLVTNNGAITGPVTANTDQGIEFVNATFGTVSKAAGSQYAIDLTGNGGRFVVNDGEIFGSVRTGNGWDTFLNSGLVQGQVRLGNGNDTLTNQIIAGIDGGPATVGTITSGVFMGAGDDTVLNTGVMGNIFLGTGNDTYTVDGFLTDGIDGGIDGLPFGFEDFSEGTGSAGNVFGGAGEDTITGGVSDDRFFGGADDDLISGNGGRDALFGQDGDDDIFGGAGNDYIAAGNGNDFVDGGNNNDRVFGGAGNDIVVGGQGNDLVAGGADDDRVFGGNGHDRMFGNDGNDTMEGGQGRDVLSGGAGADVFVFGGRTNGDIITDFSAGDQIELVLRPTGDFITTYDDIIDNTVFVGGNAVIDLSAIFNLDYVSGPRDNGSTLTVNNVTIDDLGESAFNIVDNIFIVG